MSGRTGAMVLACLLASPPEERVCRHPARGPSRPISLARVADARRELERTLREAWRLDGRLSRGTPWDSGLPACRGRSSRRVAVRLPGALVGRTIGFGPAGRIPAADYRVATKARRLDEVDAHALADPALAARLGVRCWPSRATVISERELELQEDP